MQTRGHIRCTVDPHLTILNRGLPEPTAHHLARLADPQVVGIALFLSQQLKGYNTCAMPGH